MNAVRCPPEMEFDLLKHSIMAMRPGRLSCTSPWPGVIPLAFLLVSLVRPKIFVELGTTDGDSYCAFCQAIDTLRINTACRAIAGIKDEAQAEEHDNADVFEELKLYHDPLYASFSRLLHAPASPAQVDFTDNSVDLLHMILSGGNEAVKKSFAAWRPKLSPQSIVLFQGIYARNHAGKTSSYWEELKKGYPSVELPIGPGLGLLATGLNIPGPITGLFALDEAKLRTFTAVLNSVGESVQSPGLHEKLHCQQATIEIQNEQLVVQKNIVGSILSSKCWKITAPLRSAADIKHKMAMLTPFLNCLVRNPRLLSRNLPKVFWSNFKIEKKVFWSLIKAIILLPTQPYTLLHYKDWRRQRDSRLDLLQSDLEKEIDRFPQKPVISILMPTYNTPEKWLRKAIDSVLKQSYPFWQLCIADDASTNHAVREVIKEYQKQDSRIKVVFRTENGHISVATNTALQLASGDYVALLDHDDELDAHALLQVAREINAWPSCKMIYSDEDKITESGEHKEPYFKPAWNQDLFLSQNVICHLGVYETERLKKIGGFRPGFEGAQDYDMTLRFIEGITPQEIRHIPDILYHWRIIPGSTAAGPQEKNYAAEAGKRAVSEFLQRRKDIADVETITHLGTMQRIRYHIPSPRPLVSIIIPTRDGAKILKTCVDSLITKTAYQKFELLIVDNNSTEPDTRAYFQELESNRIARILNYHKPFNYPEINNFAVSRAQGEIICLLNNDTEVIEADWLTEMVSHAIRREVGAVGAKLLYPNGSVQHAGIILGIGGVAGHAHKHFPGNHYGYFARAVLTQNVSAVTGACLVVRKKLYDEVGGLDGVHFPVAFNDVDFCLRLLEKGYRNVFTPFAVLYHHESISRGYENSLTKNVRFQKEALAMKSRWREVLSDDPAYNRNLTLTAENFDLRWPLPS